MIAESIEAEATDDIHMTPDQKKCVQELIEKLKQITRKIEELDDQEQKILGESEGSNDQRRAINISRAVFVNEQKEVENKLSNILDSCEPMKSSGTDLSGSGEDTSREEPTIELISNRPEGFHKESSTDNNPETSDRDRSDDIEMIPATPKQRSQEPGQWRKASQKAMPEYHVLSFKICPVCGARVPANFRICGRCATRLQSFCPHCSAAVPDGVAFCGKCGKKIT